ncbi:hypothetical protein [Microbacterium sp.]|uniref:hypothetical protein n=1 Tax=Microbacterium sp. TaxID=51671 RepID=UPI003C25291B
MSTPTFLTPLLGLEESTVESKVEYVIGGLGLIDATREVVAQLIADDAMVVACGASPVLDRWRQRRDGGPAATGPQLEAVKAFVAIGFGNPGSPKNVDHVQGHVAELLWHRMVAERTVCRDGRTLVDAPPIKADALEPGGDGLVVYGDLDGELVFRLWEIKKHDASGAVSKTINRAAKQLRKRGHHYLAKLAGPATLTAQGALGELYDGMVDLWFERSERAGVGVSVGASSEHRPRGRNAFKSLRTQFPEFAAAAQTESIVLTIPDFPEFADRVKEVVWSGL